MKPSISYPVLLLTFLFFLLHTPYSVSAQDTYEEWRQQYLQEYQQFKDARDSLFTEMLNQHWEQFEAFKSGESYEEPKPVELPKSEPVDRPRVPADFPEDQIPTIRFDIPDEELDEPMDQRPPPPPSPPSQTETRETASTANFDAGFYNNTVLLPVDEEIKNIPVNESFKKEDIAKFWEQMSTSDFESLHKEFMNHKETWSLNDWGFAKMVHQTGSQLYDGNTSMANMFTWFFLSKAGFNARVGYNDDGVYLMLPSKNTIFANSFFEIGDHRYYIVGFGELATDPGGLYSYDGNYPDADNLVSTSVENIPKFEPEIITRDLSFSYRGESYDVSVEVNKNLISFYEYYPQTDFEVYFNAPVATETSKSLLNALKPIIEGKSETDAVNMLLRFTQTAFKYKVDPDNFGREKPLFPEETIYYEYSDCEDRAILFSFLVRNLVGLDIVGLHYPGHVATAVKFNVPVEGDSVTVNGATYTIADPTYINADIGMEMPDFKGLDREIIFVE